MKKPEICISLNAIRRLTYISTLFDLSADDEATVKSIIFDPDNVENGKPYIGDFYQPAISRVIGNEDGDDEGKYWEALVAQIEKNTSGVRTFSWTIYQSMSTTDQAAMSPRLLRY